MRSRHRIFNAELERLDVKYRETLVENVKLMAHGSDCAGGIEGGRANVERRHVGRAILIGEVDHGRRSAAEIVVVAVPDHAHHLKAMSLAAVDVLDGTA